MDDGEAYELIRAANRVASALGAADVVDGSIADQINVLAKATDRIADALNRIADAMEAQIGN